MAKILFNTANLVARFSGYRLIDADWGAHERKTIESTTDAEFAKICAEIKATGFDALELWIAHCHPSKVTVEGAKVRRKIAADHGLSVDALACAYTRDHLAVAEALGVSCINGGLWGTDLASVKELVKASSVAYNYENHPEKTPREILQRIEGGNEKIGVALDTGWIGISGLVEATEFIDVLGGLLRHVHLKDVEKRGSHSTVKLGTGCVGIEGVIARMKAGGYAGMWSWEDEPEARNPTLIAAEMREYISARL